MSSSKTGDPLEHDPSTVFFNLHKPALWEPFFKALPSFNKCVLDIFREGAELTIPTRTLQLMYGRVFASSVSWMLAHAELQGATEILLNGIDLEDATEVRHRDSLFYLVGLLTGRGTKVLHVDDRMFRWPTYPTEDAETDWPYVRPK